MSQIGRNLTDTVEGILHGKSYLIHDRDPLFTADSLSMLALGDLLTQVERKMPVVRIILTNDSLDFVKIEQQEGGIIPFGVDFKNPNFAKVAEVMGAKGIRIEEPGDVGDGPVVVEAGVDLSLSRGRRTRLFTLHRKDIWRLRVLAPARPYRSDRYNVLAQAPVNGSGDASVLFRGQSWLRQ